METNQELAVIEQPTELVNVAKESGIEISKAELITLKYVPFLLKIREAEQDSAKINFENPTELDEKIVREIRLKLVPNRTGADKFKKEEKAEAALLNGLHDGAYKIVENASKLLELKLEQVEKQREIKRKADIEALRFARAEEIKQYGENYAAMDLGNMSEEMYQSIFSGAKLNHEAKVKAELEALEKQKAEQERAVEFQRRKDALFIIGCAFDGSVYSVGIESISLHELSICNSNEFEEFSNKAKTLIKEQKEKEAAELKRLKEENEIKEKQLELERIEAKKKEDAAAAELKAANDKAESERKESERLAKIESDKQAKILADQKAANDKLQAELKAKADAEAKLKADAAKAEAQRLADEKKALKAPDKEKIKQVAMQLGVIRDSLPTLKTEEGAKIILDIKTLIEKTINYSREKAETL